MANFIENEAVREKLAETAKQADKLHMSVATIAQSANASFAFENGDKLTIPAQVAKIVPLQGTILESARANKRAEGYFAFDAFVTRNKKEVPCSVSLRQLYTPTVWTEAEPLDGIKDADGEPLDAFHAPYRDGKKRFGENGTILTEKNVPYVPKDIVVEISLQDVYTPLFLDETQREVLEDKHTALVKRTNYGVAL